MSRAFADICFTDSVKDAQTLYGSREANQGFEQTPEAHRELSQREMDFIAARDSFYQATVSESGWPYVQHRGGATGFLKVLDSQTLGYADFRGNRQYLSVGNLTANDQISMILMDYANRRRLKIWGRVHIIHETEYPELIAKLEDTSYRARIERAVIITVEAWDWNCPQHITQRFTPSEISSAIQPLHDEIARLKAQIQQLQESQS